MEENKDDIFDSPTDGGRHKEREKLCGCGDRYRLARAILILPPHCARNPGSKVLREDLCKNPEVMTSSAFV